MDSIFRGIQEKRGRGKKKYPHQADMHVKFENDEFYLLKRMAALLKKRGQYRVRLHVLFGMYFNCN